MHEQQPRLNGNPIADTSIRQPVLITMLTLLLVVLGLLAYRGLSISLLPNFDIPVVAVSMRYPGAGPEVVADQVARPLEDELATLNGLRRITSDSTEGQTTILTEFVAGTDSAQALQEVREKVNALRPALPNGVREPLIERYDPNQSPILSVVIASSGGRSGLELRNLLTQEFVPAVQRVPGVAAARVNGGLVRQININLDLNRMQSFRLLPSAVGDAVAAANANVGLGTALQGDQNISLRVPNIIERPADLARVGIPGTNLTVGDVATVSDGTADVQGFTRLNGQEALTLDVRRQSGANTVAASEGALQAINEVAARYPDLSVTTIYDDGASVRQQVNGAIEEMLLALLFAVLVVWLFFRDIRNTLITVAGMPVILIATFAGMQVFGLSINVLTLLALSISVGLVIDDAMVVRENIFRRMELGEAPDVASSRGAAELALAVLASTLTVVAAFAPAIFAEGIAGIIFKSFSIVVVVAILLSLLEAYTLAPMMSAHLFKRKQQQTTEADGAVLSADEHELHASHAPRTWWERLYSVALAWSLRRRWATIGLGAAVLLVTGVIATSQPVGFLPATEEYRFDATLTLPPGTPLAETDRVAREIEARLSADPAVEAVLATVGGAGSAERASFLVRLKRDSGSTAANLERLRPALAAYPTLVFSQPSADGSAGTDATSRPIQVRLRGNDVAELTALVPQVQAAMGEVNGLTEIESSSRPGKRELRYELNQARANSYGINNQELANTMQTLVNGSTVGSFKENERSFDIVVRLRPEDRQQVERLSEVRLPLNGELVPLGNLVTLREGTSPTSIRRAARQVEVVVGANVSGRNVAEAQSEVEARLAGLSLPAGVNLSFGGTTEEQEQGFTSLLLAMVLSVVFIYMVLASQFRSFSQPFILMLSMPLSFIGAFLALQISGITLDLFGMIGMLMLLGLATKNSILLIDLTNRLRERGMEKHQALKQAGAARLRPIIMTSMTVIFGAIPTVLGVGDGSELRQGLATAVLGGTITSTLLTLVFVPAAYSLFDGLMSRMQRRTPRHETEDRRPETGATPAIDKVTR